MKKYIPLLLLGTIILLFVLFPMPMLGITIGFLIIGGLAWFGHIVRKWMGIEDGC